MPSGRKVAVVDYNEIRQTYVCMLNTHDIDDHQHMTKRQLMEARLVEFTPEFLLKHCKENK